jgi:hypothetical protein
MNIEYRKATLSDVVKLSILFKQVYISAYGTKSVPMNLKSYNQTMEM